MPTITILDAYTTNPGDLSWAPVAALGQLTLYEHTLPAQTVERARDTELLLSNKTVLGRAELEALPALRYIGLLSTGYNVVDLQAARERGVPVTNIPAYSTAGVAQQVFALLLELTNRTQLHSDSVRAGDWCRSRDFCYQLAPLTELAGKTMGIVGFGRIGQAVAGIAEAFGMRVLAHDPARALEPLETVLRQSDVLTLHCPLTPETEGLIRREALALMKPGAILINTARGPVLNEADVAAALRSGHLGALAADVLSIEPPREDNPLLTAPNCILTPHISWATKEARARLIAIAAENIAGFLGGKLINVVN
ncbi:MAG: D-2-hydroxyacid dehydrogenase [Oscillospiraceae bacterium]|nr:D-2-hydroxyacid dehydrogenase [Oscillospiraceae bacterium]